MMRKALVQARGPRGQPIPKSCLPSTLALGEWDGKGTCLAYYPGMMCQNGNPPLRSFLWFVLVLPGLVLCSSTGLPGEKRRDVGAREAWVYIPALPLSGCGICNKKKLHLSGLWISSSRL